MAYFSQEMKKAIAPKIKEICKKYDVKASLGVRHHSEVVLNIASGAIDFIANANEVMKNDPYAAADAREVKHNINVNQYHYEKHFSDKALDFLKEVLTVLNTGNYDKSDIQTDYFNVGFYVDVNIGKWDKPYVVTKK
ncbi:molecular chaperone DnaJ [Sinorhizobium phage phiM7]|uniref:Molecular chaperone DnaJ n=2 Tax=Emdodecavirus TaxID=1980937 RepID=S5MDC8_9CAUD|nr:hypothetical protein AB690_gp255 [Sinorhizobium phage phiM12]YP_009601380.1 molecular chaperone DnaJ [Sinorhizobium phage phiM7]AGR47969.1 hypothetical protein SmphiM12_337 [Sinorhizobium phage phiM12]AKF12800.1 molecular chaperone DnaJ [Sinorhizobium phage phiM7]AKF13160.1 molecular chaperone DnaJ [Sinorhizobium phage phiM19]